MKSLKYITNIKGILPNVKIKEDGSIMQSDVTKTFMVVAKPKRNVFAGKAFALSLIGKTTNFERIADLAETLVEKDDRLILKGKDVEVEYIKSDDDTIPSEELPASLPPFVSKYDKAVKFILTDEVKTKVKEAMETGFGTYVTFFSDGTNIKVGAGGKDGKNKITYTVGSCSKSFSSIIENENVKAVLDSTKGFAEMYFMPDEELKDSAIKGFPLKVTDKTDDYDTEIYVAPRTE